MSKTTDYLHSTADRLLRGSGICSFACDSLLFGALVKQMRHLGLHWPKGSGSAPAFSPSELFQAVRAFKAPEVCNSFGMACREDRDENSNQHYSRSYYDSYCSKHGCKLEQFLGYIAYLEVNDRHAKRSRELSRLT